MRSFVLFALLSCFLLGCGEQEMTACHQNKTCDTGRCYTIDSKPLCVSDVEHVDPRVGTYLKLVDRELWFPDKNACLEMRGFLAQQYPTISYCTAFGQPDKPIVQTAKSLPVAPEVPTATVTATPQPTDGDSVPLPTGERKPGWGEVPDTTATEDGM